MEIFSFALSSLLLCIGTDHQVTGHTTPVMNKPCLMGNWTNQLGSVMSITTFADGNMDGLYNSGVGQATREYILKGRYLYVENKGYVMGWTVAYKNQYMDAKSTASWTGIYYPSKDQILTQWVLASFKDEDNFWSAFWTNQDYFRRMGNDTTKDVCY